MFGDYDYVNRKVDSPYNSHLPKLNIETDKSLSNHLLKYKYFRYTKGIYTIDIFISTTN